MYDVGSVTIVSEQRHEVGHGVEAAVHQVRVELDLDTLPPSGRSATRPWSASSARRVLARACIEERAVEAGDL